MAADAKFRIVFEGDDKQQLAQIDKVVKGLNDAKQATTRYSKERQKFAQDERRARFQALSDDEKRVRLTQRQITLERQLSRARASGNGLRASALGLSLARNRAAQGGIRDASGGGGGVGGALALGARGLGALGIGVSIAAIGHSMARAVSGSVRFADEISDIADQMGLTRIQVLQIRRAATAAGVPSGRVFAGLSALAAARSAALSGDSNAMATFGKYGISRKQLAGKLDNLTIGSRIAGSLGAGGMQPTDRGPLGTLLGRRPEQTLSVLRQQSGLEGAKEIERQLKVLDDVNVRVEGVMNRWQLIMVGVSEKIFNAFDYLASKGEQYAKWWTGMGLPNLIQLTPGSSPLPLSAAAQARKNTRLGLDVRTASNTPMPTGSNAGSNETVTLLRKQLKVAEDNLRVSKEQKYILSNDL